ncbi:MAG TPA: hypothetical protein VF721_00285 [Pyrinomonadaceae bacterium]|jgi:hypothetical protein
MFRKFLAFVFAFFLTLAFAAALPAKTKSKNKSAGKITAAKYPALQNELFAMRVLREIYAAQATYYLTVGNGRFAGGIQLLNANLIDNAVATGVKYGYIYGISEVFISGAPRFVATATPYRYGKTAKRSFYIDSGCKLRGANKFGQQADADAPLIEICTPTLAYENERKTIAAMRSLDTAQLRYRAAIGNGDYGTLTQLYNAGLINAYLAGGHYAGSVYMVVVLAQHQFQTAFYYSQSVPILYGETGFRSFYIDATGILRGADRQGLFATVSDPPIQE